MTGNFPNSLNAKSLSFGALQIAEKPQCHRHHQERRKPFLKNLFHFVFLFGNKSDEVRQELDEQSRSDHRAADVRCQPARIAHDRQHRRRHAPGLFRDLAGVHLVLIKRQPVVAQRMVHGNFHLAVFARLRIFQLHAAAEILRDVRAGINRVRRLEQRQRKRMINPRRSHHEREFLAADLDGLRRGQLAGDGVRHVRAELLRVAVLHRLDQRRVARPVGNRPVAERTVRAGQFDDGRRDIFFVRRLHVAATGGNQNPARCRCSASGGAFFIIGARKLTSEFFQKVFTRMANGRLSIFSSSPGFNNFAGMAVTWSPFMKISSYSVALSE